MRRQMLAAALLLAAQIGAAQTTPPPPAPPRQIALPKASEKTLRNGLRVIVVPKHTSPLVSARLMILTGSEEDTREFAGLASLTASLITQGTRTRSAEQIARGIEALGTTLQTSAGWDVSAVDVTVMSPNLAQAMTYVADVVRNPVFEPEEIERLREQSIDSLRVSLQEPLSLARYVAARVVFQEGPYGQNAAGTPESLERIGRDQIVGFHRRHYRPDNAVLVIAGDIKPQAAFAIAQKSFGRWRSQSRGARSGPIEKPAPQNPKPRVVVVDMPDAGQAAVLVTRLGLRRVDPRYFTAIVTNSVLGGGYSSRLNQEIRIKRGLSYGAGSTFELRSEEGPFSAWTQTKNESAAEVAGLIVDEMTRLAAVELSDAELTPRKAVVTGSFSESMETTAGIVGRVSALALHGLPLEDISSFVSRVQAVTGENVRSFARSHLGGDTASVVIVGDASKFLDPLRERFGSVDVIPVEELDLERAELRRGARSVHFRKDVRDQCDGDDGDDHPRGHAVAGRRRADVLVHDLARDVMFVLWFSHTVVSSNPRAIRPPDRAVGRHPLQPPRLPAV